MKDEAVPVLERVRELALKRDGNDQRGQPRKVTVAAARFTKEEVAAGRLLSMPDDVERPRNRADCAAVERPCPFVGCKHHLYLDVNPETGSITFNYPDLDPSELLESCALDVAEYGGITLEETGQVMALTRERIRQLEVRALITLRVDSGLGGPGESPFELVHRKGRLPHGE